MTFVKSFNVIFLDAPVYFCKEIDLCLIMSVCVSRFLWLFSYPSSQSSIGYKTNVKANMTKDDFECFDLLLKTVKKLEFFPQRHNPVNK